MYNVKSTSPTEVFADSEQQKEVSNASGGTVYYKTATDVDAEDTALESGKSVVISQTTYFISASTSMIHVRDLKTSNLEDVTIADDLIVGDDLTVGGDAEINGELNHDGAKVGFFGTAPAAQPDIKPAAEATAKEICEALVTLGLVK